MRTRFIALFLALIASAAFAQYSKPVIYSVTPDQGPAAGGTTVTITGESFYVCPPYMTPCTVPVVRIGSKEATILEKTMNTLVVVTPPSPGGTYAVEVSTQGGTGRATNAFTYGSKNFERVLLPVYIEGEMAGWLSRWTTDLFGFNRGTKAVRVTDDPDACSNDCQDSVAAKAPFHPAIHTARQGSPRFIYVTSGSVDSLSINLRVRDISRSADNLGTELPVVTADQTFSANSTIALVNVPTAAGYREKLRIYDFDGENGRTVRVKIAGEDWQNPIITREVTLSSGDVNVDFPSYPGYAELDLNLIPELAGLERVTVVVETPGEGRFWAYVSVTNNDTQQITTVTP